MDEQEEMSQQEYEAQVRENPEQAQQLTVGTRELQRKERVSEILTELLKPQTQGFDHINLDMTFTQLDRYDSYEVQNLSMLISGCRIFGLQKSEYLLRGKLATKLNANRSRDGKSMDMMTTVQTKSEQEFKDTSKENKGFSFMPWGNKNKSNRGGR